MFDPKKYYVDVLIDVDFSHLVHTESCENLSPPPNRKLVGSFDSLDLALKKAKEKNPTYILKICKKCCYD